MYSVDKLILNKKIYVNVLNNLFYFISILLQNEDSKIYVIVSCACYLISP